MNRRVLLRFVSPVKFSQSKRRKGHLGEIVPKRRREVVPFRELGPLRRRPGFGGVVCESLTLAGTRHGRIQCRSRIDLRHRHALVGTDGRVLTCAVGVM